MMQYVESKQNGSRKVHLYKSDNTRLWMTKFDAIPGCLMSTSKTKIYKSEAMARKYF